MDEQQKNPGRAPGHYEQSVERDLGRIRRKLSEMSALAQRALKDCIKALMENNRQLAYGVILRDQFIDELEKEIDRLALEFLVRQQPVAGLLRFAYATIKVNLELERVGDYAESMARQTLKLGSQKVTYPKERFVEMAYTVIPMVEDAVQAFIEQNAELARKVIEREDAVDLLKRQLNQELVQQFRAGQLTFEALNPLMMIARRLERVSDQARNISMEVLYLCTGEYAKHPGAEAIRVLFVDEHNACRSLMAEAIASRMNLPRFIFASAGLDPLPASQDTVNFLKEKGMDVSGHSPKALNQVPNLDHYHVIVALSPEVRRAFPQKPRKVVFLDWTVPDPSVVEGGEAEKRAAYEQVYNYISEHLKDLVAAIIGQEDQSKQ
jgi:phosphate transport system protein